MFLGNSAINLQVIHELVSFPGILAIEFFMEIVVCLKIVLELVIFVSIDNRSINFFSPICIRWYTKFIMLVQYSVANIFTIKWVLCHSDQIEFWIFALVLMCDVIKRIFQLSTVIIVRFTYWSRYSADNLSKLNGAFSEQYPCKQKK